MGIQPKPMTFLEANEGRGNVNYGKGKAYDENCQSCVVVHEARLRGLNVTANGYDENKNSVSFKLGEKFESAWINTKTGKVPQITKVSDGVKDEIYNLVDKNTKSQGRYHIGINYKNGNGHVITAERLKDGKIMYYDAQNGLFVNLSEFTKIDYFEILKVDKLLINPDVFRAICSVIR